MAKYRRAKERGSGGVPARLDVNLFDYVLLAIYCSLVITIGVLARRAIATSEDFLLSGRSVGRCPPG